MFEALGAGEGSWVPMRFDEVEILGNSYKNLIINPACLGLGHPACQKQDQPVSLK